jgi:hypothetical protein
MEKKPTNTSKTIRSILIAAAIGIGVALLLGAVSTLLQIPISGSVSGAIIGASIGFSFVLLNNRKDA